MRAQIRGANDGGLGLTVAGMERERQPNGPEMMAVAAPALRPEGTGDRELFAGIARMQRGERRDECVVRDAVARGKEQRRETGVPSVGLRAQIRRTDNSGFALVVPHVQR